MSDAPKAKRADRTGSRLLRALHGRLVGYMARAGLIAFAADPGADAGAGGTHLGGDASGGGDAGAGGGQPAGDKPAGDAAGATGKDGDKPAGDAAGDKPVGDKPAADAGAKPGDKPQDKPAEGAPEKYENFTLPDGLKLDEAVMGEFSALAKELNLPQAAAQKLVDIGARMQQGTAEQMQAAMVAQAEKWGTESQVDKEFGGDKFSENLSVAKKALDQFGSPEFKAFLRDSKLGNHPEVIRFMFRAGQAISQDGFVPGRSGANASQDARSMYSASNMNP